MNLKTNIYLPDKIGKGYKQFWNSKHRYLVCKGSRGSKKSTTAAQKIIYNIMKYPLSNALVIRKTFNTHRDSTFAQLRWAARNLGVEHLFSFPKGKVEITYKPTGQKILFRGLDDPMSITSITVDKGFINFVWFEEAYQIDKEDDFNKIDMSIRGQIPNNYYKQLIVTFNPWSDTHWLKKKFFDKEADNILAMTTNYLCNEWLGPDDIEVFDYMKNNNPRRYEIEGLGNWGISEGLIYENWEEYDFNEEELKKTNKKLITCYGLDFGFKADPTAIGKMLVDVDKKIIYICDEIYKHGLLNSEIANLIKYKGWDKEIIYCDNAEQKSIAELNKNGIPNARPCKKGPGSVLAGIDLIQQFKIYAHPKCKNAKTELSLYCWGKDKDGKLTNKPVDNNNHYMDQMRYAIQRIEHINVNLYNHSTLRR